MYVDKNEMREATVSQTANANEMEKKKWAFRLCARHNEQLKSVYQIHIA